MGSNFCGFRGLFGNPQKSSRQKKLPQKIFCKNFSIVDILMVDIGYGIESDSENEEEYRLEDENTVDNRVDNQGCCLRKKFESPPGS